jgi:hypothetical protein
MSISISLGERCIFEIALFLTAFALEANLNVEMDSSPCCLSFDDVQRSVVLELPPKDS